MRATTTCIPKKRRQRARGGQRVDRKHISKKYRTRTQSSDVTNAQRFFCLMPGPFRLPRPLLVRNRKGGSTACQPNSYYVSSKRPLHRARSSQSTKTHSYCSARNLKSKGGPHALLPPAASKRSPPSRRRSFPPQTALAASARRKRSVCGAVEHRGVSETVNATVYSAKLFGKHD